MIVNSDNAQSISDADNYVLRRGLNQACRLAFSMGTVNAWNATQLKTAGPLCATPPYNGMPFVPAVAAYMLANDIEGVICSTYTSTAVDPQVGLRPGMTATLSAWASGAVFYNSNPVGTLISYFGSGIDRRTAKSLIAQVDQEWQINTWHQVPHGRLGCPDYAGGVIAEKPLNTGGSVYSNAVSVAMSAELLNHQRGTHILSDVLSYSIITAAKNKIAFDWAVTINMPSRIDLGVQLQVSDLLAGSSTSPVSLFSYCIGVSLEGKNPTNIAPEAGAWGFAWTSSAGVFGSILLSAGGAAAVMTYGEPYSDCLAEPQELFVYATAYQLPLMVAAFLAHSSGTGYTVCGDPLYAPYLQLPTYVDPSTIRGLP
jgi:hypothetical protein